MPLALPILDTQPVRPAFAQGPRSLQAVRLLRLSVTDRCNMRCLYCMPDDGVAFVDRQELLSAADLIAVARAAASVGVTHFKITGGEPTVRHDLLSIIEGLAALKPMDLSMTTNGLLLADMAHDLRSAGLHRLTVSWDTMRPQRMARITRGGAHTAEHGRQRLDTLRRGLEAAGSAGFERIKINVVVIGGINDDEVAEFAALTLDYPWTVRFIEYMPLGDSTLVEDASLYLVDNDIVRREIEATHGPLAPIARENESGVGPATVFRIDKPETRGRIGFISAMSKPFCETCNRLRLTATGELRSCLFDGGEVNVLPALHPTPRLDRIVELMAQCVALKPELHSHRGNRAMSQLGG